jgi:crossover junction endodeoxyribonuclease RuvC
MNLSGIEITIGIDPGFSGAIAVIMGNSAVLYDIPTFSVITAKKTKKREYDIESLVKLIAPLAVSSPETTVCVEDVTAMPKEGVTSSFNFGFGKGMLLGVMTALFHKKPMLVRPAAWKKAYPELSSGIEVSGLKDKIGSLRSEIKDTLKQLEELPKKDHGRKNLTIMKKDLQKEVDRLGRQRKALAKDASRILASELYPDIAGLLKLKKHDGRAEALLIAHYAKRIALSD